MLSRTQENTPNNDGVQKGSPSLPPPEVLSYFVSRLRRAFEFPVRLPVTVGGFHSRGNMAKKMIGAVALLLVWGSRAPAQQFPPGYVNPAPLLAAAAAEIGEANLRCITFSGTGYSGAVGQTFENAVSIDWPRIDAMANYTRTINWETGTSKETFDRRPGLNPALMEVREGLAGGHADSNGDAPDAHR